jgi:hypothetical protein
VAVAAYALLGFVLAPRLIRPHLERRLGAVLHRPVAIARLRMNPFALSVTVEGFRVTDRDGSPFVSWDSLYVNVDAWPLVLRQLDFAHVRLVRPRVRVALGKDGALNFADLVDALGGSPSPAKPKTESSPLVVDVDRLEIEEAQLAFSDRSRAAPFDSTIGPFTIRLSAFRTRADAKSPYAFSGRTESGESFSWSGFVYVDPLRSSGTIAFDDVRLPKYAPYYSDRVGFDLRDGVAAARASYDFEWGAQRRARLHEATLTVKRLAMARRGHEPEIVLPSLEIAGASVDLLGRNAEVASVKLRDLAVEVRRDKDGRLGLSELAAPQPGPAAPHAATPQPVPSRSAAPEPAPAPFRYVVRAVELANGRIDVEDLVPARPVKLGLHGVGFAVQDVSSDRDARSPFTATLSVGEKGAVSAKGEVLLGQRRGELALRVSDVDLVPVSPYLSSQGGLDVRLDGGRLGVDGTVRWDLVPATPHLGFEGDVRIDGVAAADAVRGDEVVRWSTLAVSGVSWSSEPPRASVKAVRWVEPRLAFVVAPDGTSNVGRMRPAAAQAPTAAPPVPAAAPPGGHPPAPTPVSVALVEVVRGRLSYADRSVRPAVQWACTDLAATARNVATGPGARPRVEFRCKAEGAAPFEMAGVLHPLLRGDGTDFRVTSKGVDLVAFGPYSGKHLGYEIQKGKLDLDLAYRVSQRRLEGRNVVRFDQFTLGEKVDSPDATALPVKLGLAVLRDRDGIILIDVPVSGDVDDPEFSFGRVIWRAVLNVFVKAATAPFSLLTSAFGGGQENLDVLDLAPGATQPDAAARKKVEALSRALRERPALALEVEGAVDERADGAALRRRAVAAMVRKAKWEAVRASKPAVTLAEVEVSADEYERWLRAASEARATPAAGAVGPAPTPPPSPAAVPGAGTGAASAAELEQRLAASVELAPDELRALATQRATEARDLVLAAGIDESRVFLVSGGERARNEQGARVYFTLR